MPAVYRPMPAARVMRFSACPSVWLSVCLVYLQRQQRSISEVVPGFAGRTTVHPHMGPGCCVELVCKSSSVPVSFYLLLSVCLPISVAIHANFVCYVISCGEWNCPPRGLGGQFHPSFGDCFALRPTSTAHMSPIREVLTKV